MSGEISVDTVTTASLSGTNASSTGVVTAGTTIHANGDITSTAGGLSSDGNITAGGYISSDACVYDGFMGDTGKVKVIWSDFQTDDDSLGSNIHVYDPSAPRPDGLRINNTSSEVYASVQIPWGYTATGYVIWCSDTVESRLFECYIDDTTNVQKHIGVTRTYYTSVISVPATTTNFISLYVLLATGQTINGGWLYIEKS
jgi:hypothetical protein